MNNVQDKCLRHSTSFIQNTPVVKKPLTPARVARGPSRKEKIDQYLSFVYHGHKAPEDESESPSASFVTKTASNISKSGSSKILNSAASGPAKYHSQTKKVTFGLAD